jgi:UDPglucose 6-dehydrogenase
MKSFKLVVDKSTVPVGTADRVKAGMHEELAARGLAIEFGVASNPEFLKEVAAVDDFMKPDRIVIGTDSGQATQLLRNLYMPFQRNRDRLPVMDVRSAELTKNTANAMLATRISFMNEMAILAEKLGTDVKHVRHGIGADPRIGYHFLYAGCGYGGSCINKDVQALRRTAQENDIPMRVLDAVELANEAQKSVLVNKIVARYGKDLKGRHFAMWGLAFKHNTVDMREAPSQTMKETLWRIGATVAAHDPAAMEQTRGIYGQHADPTLAVNPMAALQGDDTLLIVTEWKAFRSPSFEIIKSLLKAPVIFDGRNLYEPAAMRHQGFEYFPSGRQL